MRKPFLALAVTGFLTGSVASTIRTAASPSLSLRQATTHIGIPIDRFGNFESAWVSPGTSNARFNYDWASNDQVTIPSDWSFVVTDITVTPVNVSTADPYVRAVISMSADNQRQFESIFRSGSQQRYHFTGGMVIGPDTMPVVYNSPNSDVQVQVQMLGYYAKGTPQDTAVPPTL